LAGFLSARNLAFIAICMQKLRNAAVQPQPGQCLGSEADAEGSPAAGILDQQTLFTQSLSGSDGKPRAVGTTPAFTLGIEEQFAMDVQTASFGQTEFQPQVGRSVSIEQAAQLLGVSRRTVYYRIRDGRLRTIRTLGGSQRVLLDSVEQLRSVG
jgi:excisionase family DNA binding protein